MVSACAPRRHLHPHRRRQLELLRAEPVLLLVPVRRRGEHLRAGRSDERRSEQLELLRAEPVLLLVPVRRRGEHLRAGRSDERRGELLRAGRAAGPNDERGTAAIRAR